MLNFLRHAQFDSSLLVTINSSLFCVSEHGSICANFPLNSFQTEERTNPTLKNWTEISKNKKRY